MKETNETIYIEVEEKKEATRVPVLNIMERYAEFFKRKDQIGEVRK